MRIKRLLINCIKYCKSEKISHFTSDENLILCINGKFVLFKFNELNPKLEKKILRGGGQIYSPSTLEDFVKTIRALQSKE